MAEQILKGVRIVEFGWAVVGPLTTSWAGGYGAEVIKVETKTRPDVIRTMTPFKNDEFHLDNSLFFGRENANKMSMALNLKDPRAVEIAKRLVSISDVVLDSYTSGVMDKWGLGYEDLTKVKPDIIMLSSCMYGQTGRLRSMPGYGVPLTAISGLTYLAGYPDRKPTGPYASYTDYLVPRFNLLGLVSALDWRRRTGKGVYIDAAQLECSTQFMAPALLDQDLNGRTAQRMGSRDPHAAPHGVYRCLGKERWCAITVFSEEQWHGLCQALDKPEWLERPEFADLEGRLANQDELDRLIEQWTSQREDRLVMETLQGHGVPAGVANNGKDLASDPQLSYEGYYTRHEHPRMGQVDYAAHSISFSDAGEVVWRSPCLGEHTEKVCLEIMGMEPEEYRLLHEQGAFK